MPQLLALPLELIWLILYHLESKREINAAVQTCRYFYETFNVYLYRYDTKNHNRSALSWAARHNSGATLAKSLNAGPYTEVRDRDGNTPLILAARFCDESFLKPLLTLVNRGVDLEARNHVGRTALAEAAWRGRAEIAKLLLESGAKIESRDNDGSTPLILAAVDGHEKVVKLLLDRGAAVEAKCRLRQTALSWAAGGAHLTSVELLLERGARLNTRDTYGRTPLSHAAGPGYEAVVKRLLEAGADPNRRDFRGMSPMHYAAFFSPNEAVMRRLLEAGGDPRAIVPQGLRNCRTLADLAGTASSGTSENEAVRDLLLKAAAGDGPTGAPGTR
ncbi:ankyrin repeat-containing domain protein [Aspergillus lucknowensis]|uniref:Ankyrin repeat-containing domain protein n=1 Tax=Aspergillus lucknowensis TaxID=176173 RepID=A0ABR4LKT9_9EURO